jgi:hypothetical protein
MIVVGLGGEPSSGKTSLAFRLLEELGFPETFRKQKVGTLRFLECVREKVLVLGEYRKGELFSGTDKLSMSVQSTAVGVLQNWSRTPEMKNWSLFFEGDRLFSKTFIDSLLKLPGLDCSWFMTTAEESVLHHRHKDRGDKQTEIWLKGRKTKALNLARELKCRLLPNNNPEQQDEALRQIIKAMGV